MIKLATAALVLSLAAWSAAAQQGGGPPGVDVNVVNTPLNVHVENTSTKTPVQISETRTTCGASSCSVDLLTVPEGKRLVVEYMAVRTQLLPTGNAGGDASVRLATAFGGQNQQISLGVTRNLGPGPNSQDVFGDTVKLYADPGTAVRCLIVAPNFQNIGSTTCTITGFLEDAS